MCSHCQIRWKKNSTNLHSKQYIYIKTIILCRYTSHRVLYCIVSFVLKKTQELPVSKSIGFTKRLNQSPTVFANKIKQIDNEAGGKYVLQVRLLITKPLNIQNVAAHLLTKCISVVH